MNPKPIYLTALAACGSMFFSSCIEHNFLHSPMQGNMNAYHAVPLRSDSVKSATYVSGALSAGGMNESLSDFVFSAQASIHEAHVLGAFRLNYGASAALGSYHVENAPYYHSNQYNQYQGTEFFGAYGAFGGISAAAPLGARGEWRFIGVEGNIFHEFGNFYNYRKNFPDSLATENDKKNYIGSLGVTTELVFKGRSTNKFGIKFALGSYLRRLNYLDPAATSGYYKSHDDLIYFSNTYHFTVRKTTAYFQFNAATHAFHFQIGCNYRL